MLTLRDILGGLELGKLFDQFAEVCRVAIGTNGILWPRRSPDGEFLVAVSSTRIIPHFVLRYGGLEAGSYEVSERV